MEFSNLVHALAVRLQRRPWLAFGVGAVLLLGVRRVIPAPSTSRVLVVAVEPGASGPERERAIDETLLLAFARDSEFVARDPAIRDRLVRNVQFSDPSLGQAEAFERALRLGMDRSDPVVRARLLWLASEALAAPRERPTDEALRAYVSRHPERFSSPPTLSFEQVFISRQKHGDGFRARVALVAEDPGPRFSDPGLLPTRVRGETLSRIDARFGSGFAARLRSLETGRWYGPIPSAFGAHFVRIRAQSERLLPPFETVRERAKFELDRDNRPARLRAALAELRTSYQVRVQERV